MIPKKVRETSFTGERFLGEIFERTLESDQSFLAGSAVKAGLAFTNGASHQESSRDLPLKSSHSSFLDRQARRPSFRGQGVSICSDQLSPEFLNRGRKKHPTRSRADLQMGYVCVFICVFIHMTLTKIALQAFEVVEFCPRVRSRSFHVGSLWSCGSIKRPCGWQVRSWTLYGYVS